jgi:hypothetical protein
MHLVRIGRRYVSLEHLIVAEFADASGPSAPLPVGARLTLECGKEYELDEAEATVLRRHLDEVAVADPAERPGDGGSVGVELDPRTGVPLPRRAKGTKGGA